jgi:hypothetical protein
MSRRGGEKDAMAIDGMGNLVVLNETHMKVYCRNGDLLWVAPHNVSRGSEGSTKFCSAVVDGAGNVVAVDERNRRIVVLSAGGELVRFFGQHGEGKLDEPTDVAVDGAGSVLVAQRGRIFVFKASSGDFVGTLWPGGVLGTGVQVKPTSVAVDGAGNVFALSHDDLSFTDSLVVFDQPMRSHEEHVRKRALALFMSLHHRLGAAAFELKEEVLELIWNAVPRSTDDLSDVAPGRRIMHYIS